MSRQAQKILLLFTVIFFLGMVSYSSDITGQQIERSENNYVVAYYFHGNFRCFSCYRIEQYSKEAVEQFFEDELKSGKLIFKAINIEERSNKHFINDYQLYTKSLVISLMKNGKEVKYKNLTKVWEYLKNKQKFYGYVKDEINSYLKEL